MKRAFLLSLALVLAFAIPLSAQAQAVVKEFSGKVEMKEPGQDWQPVTVNMMVSKGATVSTGFHSRLVLEMGQTRLTVNPLTRMLLEEIVKKEATTTTSLVLRVGKVNAAVKASEGERNEFTLKGPAATAAVRGTEFEFNGYELRVIEGVVEFLNLMAQARPVGKGESSETDGYNFPTSGEVGASQDSSISSSANGLPGGTGGGQFNPPVLTGNISVTVQ
jgi:hypothetical protein